MREITMSSSSDEFYRQNMYSNFGEIGQTVKTLVQQFQAKAKSHQVSFHVIKINAMDNWVMSIRIMSNINLSNLLSSFVDKLDFLSFFLLLLDPQTKDWRQILKLSSLV